MDFAGYLIKINGMVVPGEYINGYKAIPDRQQDKNSYTDSLGETHRNILPHTKTTITFTTSFLTLQDKRKLKGMFPKREYVELQYWNDDIDSYADGIFYVPDVEYEVLDYNKETIIYRPITFEFIEY